MTGKQIYSLEAYFDGEKGDSRGKGGAYGIEYQIEKAEGSVFTAFDSNLEVIRMPERSVKNRDRSKK